MGIVRDSKGMSIIEMVVAIVIVGLAIPALTRNWVDVNMRSARTEAMADAVFYGQQIMEDITARRFDESYNPAWTPEPEFGGQRQDESGETGWDTFDDVDDFDGFTNTTPEGFVRAVEVDYIVLSTADWVHSDVETDFKRITVSVSKPRAGLGNVTLATIVGRY